MLLFSNPQGPRDREDSSKAPVASSLFPTDFRFLRPCGIRVKSEIQVRHARSRYHGNQNRLSLGHQFVSSNLKPASYESTILCLPRHFFHGQYIRPYILRGVISELSARASMEHEHFLRYLSIIQIYDPSLPRFLVAWSPRRLRLSSPRFLRIYTHDSHKRTRENIVSRVSEAVKKNSPGLINDRR